MWQISRVPQCTNVFNIGTLCPYHSKPVTVGNAYGLKGVSVLMSQFGVGSAQKTDPKAKRQ